MLSADLGKKETCVCLSRELFVLSADLVKKKRASAYRENYSCYPQIWLKRNVPLVIIGIIRVVHIFG